LFLITAWSLYVLLKNVNKNISLLFLLLNLVGVAVYSTALISQLAALQLLSGAEYLKIFQPEQLQAQVMTLLYTYKNGYMIAQLFFGAWLFPLGYLVFKSGFLPKVLGIVLMTHCFTWSFYAIQFFLFPGLVGITYVSFILGFLAEFGLTLWLLIKGAKERK